MPDCTVCRDLVGSDKSSGSLILKAEDLETSSRTSCAPCGLLWAAIQHFQPTIDWNLPHNIYVNRAQEEGWPLMIIFEVDGERIVDGIEIYTRKGMQMVDPKANR